MTKYREDVFKIYVDQLREGQEEIIDEQLDPGFLDVDDPDLVFKQPVRLEGVAYLADQELILHWNIQTEALVPCSICNEPVTIPIQIRNFYYSEPLSQIKSGIYYFKDLLRETILLEVPAFAECQGGHCPKRQQYAKYLKQSSGDSLDQEGHYHPFADFDWKS